MLWIHFKSVDRITCQYHFAKLFQLSVQPTTAKEPKLKNNQANKYSKKKDKKQQIISMIFPKNYTLL